MVDEIKVQVRYAQLCCVAGLNESFIWMRRFKLTHIFEAIGNGRPNTQPAQARVLGGDEDILAFESALANRDTGISFVAIILSSICIDEFSRGTVAGGCVNSPIWEIPTENAWSTLSVATWPFPVFHVPNLEHSHQRDIVSDHPTRIARNTRH